MDVQAPDGSTPVGVAPSGLPAMGKDRAANKLRLVAVGPGGETLTAPASVAAATYGAVAVTNAATQILAANANRKRLRLIHQSVQTLYVGFDNAVTTVTGFPLLANQPFEDPGIYTGAVWSISDGANIDTRWEEL